jgi:hypothetical protein
VCEDGRLREGARQVRMRRGAPSPTGLLVAITAPILLFFGGSAGKRLFQPSGSPLVRRQGRREVDSLT